MMNEIILTIVNKDVGRVSLQHITGHCITSISSITVDIGCVLTDLCSMWSLDDPEEQFLQLLLYNQVSIKFLFVEDQIILSSVPESVPRTLHFILTMNKILTITMLLSLNLFLSSPSTHQQ